MIHPFAPVFAKGRASLQTVQSFNVDGSGRPFLTLTGAVAGFSSGDHVFVSNATGTFPEYLGKVRGAPSGTTLPVQLDSQWSRTNGSGCLVWKPVSVWQSQRPGVGSRESVLSSGVELVETTGAVPLRTKVGEESERVTFTFSRASRFDWATYKVWMRNTAGGRLGAWTCAWWDPDAGLTRCAKVVDARPDRPLQAEQEVYALRSWVCELGIAADLTYVL